ncbi:phytanoyl-CoA dioxygenase family protein [Phenylobacterium sp.]|uniref:phytanoyl-CoA dioxygenase family protein n=1 Tax=Phenylobacterium sp. TaxID=1871053 RepID=UPI00286BD01A|nr:phytanoyl-CoA dioxygenase family protein [Phenylobacterium sp.]
MTELTRLSRSNSVEEVIAVLERDGGVIIDGFLAPETLAGLKSDLIPRMQGQSTGRDPFSGDKTRRMGALFAHTRHVAEVVTDPLYLAAARHILSKPVLTWAGDNRYETSPDVRIGVTQAIQIGPGQGAQPLHRDDTVFLWRHPTYGREARVQVMLALSDFTAENGGTLVIPGSHRWDDERQPLTSEAIPTEMTAGSALIFLGSTYHAGGQNRTQDELRTGLTIALDAANLRQEENMYLALPTAVVASYPEEIQRLLGWSAGANNMGWVEIDGQMADPIRLLRDLDGPVVGLSASR